MNNLKIKSEKMVKEALARNTSQNNACVKIDEAGSITVLVFGERVIALTPCFDDVLPGKFAFRIAIQDGCYWTHTYSRYYGLVYDTMQETLDSILSINVAELLDIIRTKDVVS